ncbi:MAG: hypothetical protein IT343_17480 [Candidatus Melainabacteria bacterium]|jgi:hypothetical protein|nr:hypothetical protein [Candidatus Melainabacteria bacterium]
MIRETLIEALKEVENSGKMLQIDQVAWLIGSFPGDDLRLLCQDCPKIQALLPEMERRNEFQALLLVADYMEREDKVGRVADLIRRYRRP